MRTKDEILVEISKINHSIEFGSNTTESAHMFGMVDGMYYVICDDDTDLPEDSVVNANTKYDFRMKTDNEIKKCVDGVISEINSQAIKPWPVDLDTTYDEGIKYGLQVAFGEVDYDASESTMINFKKGVLAGLRSAVQYKNLNSTKTQESTAKVNVKYELDKDAYRRFVNDTKQIEAEFKADNMFVGVAGEKLEGGDAVYQNTDGKMYKSDCIPANLKDACNRCIEAYPDDDMYHKFIRTHMENILEGKHTDCISCACHDTDDTTEQIPATLKGVCGWWISKYKRNSTFDEYTIMSNIAENMEYIMKSRGL